MNSYSPKEDTQIAKKHMKNAQSQESLEKCKSKFQQDVVSYLLGWEISQKQKMTNISHAMDKLRPLGIVVKNVK